MATRFRSADTRNFWIVLAFSALFDYSAAYCVTWLFDDASFATALLLLLFVYAVLAGYGLLSALRYTALFFLFDRKQRVERTVEALAAAKMPKPRKLYDRPAEYLLETINSAAASNKAKRLAGVTLGSMEALRDNQRPVLHIFANMVLEEAISSYGLKHGFRQDSDAEFEELFPAALFSDPD